MPETVEKTYYLLKDNETGYYLADNPWSYMGKPIASIPRTDNPLNAFKLEQNGFSTSYTDDDREIPDFSVKYGFTYEAVNFSYTIKD